MMTGHLVFFRQVERLDRIVEAFFNRARRDDDFRNFAVRAVNERVNSRFVPVSSADRCSGRRVGYRR